MFPFFLFCFIEEVRRGQESIERAAGRKGDAFGLFNACLPGIRLVYASAVPRISGIHDVELWMLLPALAVLPLTFKGL